MCICRTFALIIVVFVCLHIYHYVHNMYVYIAYEIAVCIWCDWCQMNTYENDTIGNDTIDGR